VPASPIHPASGNKRRTIALTPVAKSVRAIQSTLNAFGGGDQHRLEHSRHRLEHSRQRDIAVSFAPDIRVMAPVRRPASLLL
jgi:hypothetical protein